MKNQTALIIIDVQNDFCSGGALAVPDGDAVVPVINQIATGVPLVVLTQDWHPAGHFSFASRHPEHQPFATIEAGYGPQTLWPDHCVQQSHGAAFHPGLNIPQASLILRKGCDRELDSYSAFFENDHKTATGLAGYLRERGVTDLVMTGLATDFCVAWSAIDARRLGFTVDARLDACRAIDLDGSLAAALDNMKQAGVRLTGS
ncbi:MAG: bifunctional nicotinamidase/pyrazinamidase [Rhodospirillales bacterium]